MPSMMYSVELLEEREIVVVVHHADFVSQGVSDELTANHKVFGGAPVTPQHTERCAF